jgi:hypothetical protein
MMTRAQVALFQISMILMTATGVVFAWMKYFMKSDDPFAVVNHPMQPWMLAAHVVIAPLSLFAIGWIFGPHIGPGLSNPYAPKRKSGLWSFIGIAPMVFSGYLLQVSTGDTMRKAMSVTHWIASAFFLAAYVVHLLTKKNRQERNQPIQPS